MRLGISASLLLLTLLFSSCTSGAGGIAAASRVGRTGDERQLPPIRREFRGVWVATVDNIDWPSQPGLPVATQQAELVDILNRAVQLRLNAVVLQVRPMCDALYESKLEPWSAYLSGRMGQSPGYDPLEFAVREAHRRGLELHAWFNPFRASHPSNPSDLAPTHVSVQRPDWVRKYGDYLWLDPGQADVQRHSLDVIMDVVRRYDVNGIHLDDYFYPYPVKSRSGKSLEFPDAPSWKRYVAGGGRLGRDDWRRNNVNQFVERLYRAVKSERPAVKVGISPFGIWRPGNPPQIRGLDPYASLYADSRAWLQRGWVDYLSPQLYWRIDPPAQSYPVLLGWWTGQNAQARHIWPGNNISKVADGSPQAWSPEEIINQIRLTRAQGGADGNLLFSARALIEEREGLAALIRSAAYNSPALVPPSPWLDDRPPEPPRFELVADSPSGEMRVRWAPVFEDDPWLWVLRARQGGVWTAAILPGRRSTYTFALTPDGGTPEIIALSAVDRAGNMSKPVILQ